MVIFALSPLIYFKYSEFIFIEIFNLIPISPYVIYSGAIPIGISFVSFSVIAYIVDIRTGKFSQKHSRIDVINYILYFPQLIAGPILRPSQLLPNLQNKFIFFKENFKLGLLIVTIGFIKRFSLLTQ